MYFLDRAGRYRSAQVAKCEEDLNAQSISNALYGLQSMNDSPEVRLLLVALAEQVQRSLFFRR